MSKLMSQILKFGVVGGLSFLIDFIITNIIALILRNAGMTATNAAMVGALFGFVISLIFNYLLSMKWVFARREDMDRKKEFVIFVVLSAFGLGLNELIILACMSMISNIHWCAAFTQWCTDVVNIVANMTFDGMATAGSKIIATAIVMVYNFVTRKIFLEAKEDESEKVVDSQVTE
ncbi:MAG: GtrA family protein [Lachnospiraceae bacterium]|nr:GtrA family protein [Lachnospiraceae bacterium]